ncbi:hypothetical protein Y032_0177g611 [Ancylostoma ceylanicum]|uniref:SCP domain-containing protein n=1 Tax=Ancylostoma ceylanicum TaxID=53326 RepID=A0A016STX1_9BILA|nr:hypothetical protein Y032_0177g611 [Ancylostoma ceylanicum]
MFSQYQGKDISSPGEVFNDFLNNYLIQIDMNRLEVRRHGTVTSNPVYSGDDLLLGYADLVRATNTEIGCAMNMCSGPDGEPVITFYCLLNGKTIKENEEIYQGTTVNEGG